MNYDDCFSEEKKTQALPDDWKLYTKILSLGELFEDMIFRPGTSTSELTKIKTIQSETEEGYEVYDDLPEELEFFSYDQFHFKVEDLGDCAGVFNRDELSLTIDSEFLDDDSVILHELIHLHEYVINELPLYFHDMVLWALYRNLRNRIPELDSILTDNAHILIGSKIYEEGGLHDILFLLKSFDLDIRQGYPLGTVFAYGKDDEFKNYSYIK